MNYAELYDGILMLQATLESRRMDADFHEIKALAATYELQEYLAGRLADGEEFLLTSEDFSMLMRRFADAQGADLVKENERLQADPTAEVPAEVDAKCLAAIERALE